MVLINETSQIPMAPPYVESVLQPAPVPVFQQSAPVQDVLQYSRSVPANSKLSGHAPTHPNSAVCSTLRFAGAKLQAGAPDGENLPAGQALQAVVLTPLESSYRPAGQGRHAGDDAASAVVVSR